MNIFKKYKAYVEEARRLKAEEERIEWARKEAEWGKREEEHLKLVREREIEAENNRQIKNKEEDHISKIMDQLAIYGITGDAASKFKIIGIQEIIGRTRLGNLNVLEFIAGGRQKRIMVCIKCYHPLLWREEKWSSGSIHKRVRCHNCDFTGIAEIHYNRDELLGYEGLYDSLGNRL